MKIHFRFLAALLSFALFGLIAPLVFSSNETANQPVAYVYCQPKSGKCSLRINQALVKKSTIISVTGLWRYDPARETWSKTALSGPITKTATPHRRQIYSGETDDQVAELADRTGLSYVKWKEGNVEYGAFVFSGPALCNDIDIGPTAKDGKVAACIPFEDHAEADYVPDPRTYCK